MPVQSCAPEGYLVRDAPCHEPLGDETALFEAAYANRLPRRPKGPAGCGKTRFMEPMAWRLRRPLVTLSDGRPEDYDHKRGGYAIEDTRMSLIEARRRGVHPHCLTIDREGRASTGRRATRCSTTSPNCR